MGDHVVYRQTVLPILRLQQFARSNIFKRPYGFLHHFRRSGGHGTSEHPFNVGDHTCDVPDFVLDIQGFLRGDVSPELQERNQVSSGVEP